MDERTYCIVPECDEQPQPGDDMCETHQQEDEGMHRRKLTRQERLQAAADAGFDTWEEYRGER